jgi:uncharacterized protein YqeY
MSLVEKINASIKEAMLARQEGRLRGLRAIKRCYRKFNCRKRNSGAYKIGKTTQRIYRDF